MSGHCSVLAHMCYPTNNYTSFDKKFKENSLIPAETETEKKVIKKKIGIIRVCRIGFALGSFWVRLGSFFIGEKRQKLI